MSSPDLQARLRYANEKFSAARDPTRANPNVAFSFGLVLKLFHATIDST